jgi:hypothetical protein
VIGRSGLAFAIAVLAVADAASAAAPKPTLSGAFTNFAGADVAGDGNKTLRLGGRIDLYATLPIGDRVTFNFHPEFVYGQNVNNNTDGSILPLNTALLLPSNGGEDFDLSINATIKLGEKSTLMVGKINLLDLVARGYRLSAAAFSPCHRRTAAVTRTRKNTRPSAKATA